MNRNDDTGLDNSGYVGVLDRLTADVDQLLRQPDGPRGAFAAFSQLLLQEFDIRKGFLALSEGDQTRFLAVAAWKEGRTRKNLSLKLPSVSSLFEKVAEAGRIYSENYAELFDGNLIERQLLFDDDTVSFMLRPLKHDGKVVGLLGYSSDVAEAFTAFEEGLLDPAFDRLGAYLGEFRKNRLGV